jgi:hypothetical protein
LTPEELLAASMKLAAALPVLRWPFAGALMSIGADAFDVVVMNYVDLGGRGIRNYHDFDKWTDVPALMTMLLASLRWSRSDRHVSVVLFLLRAAGIALFELFGWRAALLACPNLFEVWFLYICARDRWLTGGEARERLRVPVLGAMVIVKLVQEYLLHVVGLLDRYTLKSVLERIFTVLGR